MRKRICLTLLAALLALSGCGGNGEAPAQTNAQTGAKTSSLSDKLSGGEQEPAQPEIEQPDTPAAEQAGAWPLQSAEDARRYLAGEWSCCTLYAGDGAMQLSFAEDGTYKARVDNSLGLLGWDEENTGIYSYSGGWTIKPWSEEEPFMVGLSLDATNDPLYQGMTSLGDYSFRELTLCDGWRYVSLEQLNNGDGLYTSWFLPLGSMEIRRRDDRPVTAAPRKNAQFYAHLWQVDYNPFCVWADEIDFNEDEFTYTDPVRESVRYPVVSGEGTSELSGGLEGPLTYGEAIYFLTIDADGKLVDARYVMSRLPSEEEALLCLDGYAEYREY